MRRQGCTRWRRSLYLYPSSETPDVSHCVPVVVAAAAAAAVVTSPSGNACMGRQMSQRDE